MVKKNGQDDRHRDADGYRRQLGTAEKESADDGAGADCDGAREAAGGAAAHAA